MALDRLRGPREVASAAEENLNPGVERRSHLFSNGEPTRGGAGCVCREFRCIRSKDERSLHGRAEGVAAGNQVKECGVIKKDALGGERLSLSRERRILVTQARDHRIHLESANEAPTDQHHEGEE